MSYWTKLCDRINNYSESEALPTELAFVFGDAFRSRIRRFWNQTLTVLISSPSWLARLCRSCPTKYWHFSKATSSCSSWYLLKTVRFRDRDDFFAFSWVDGSGRLYCDERPRIRSIPKARSIDRMVVGIVVIFRLRSLSKISKDCIVFWKFLFFKVNLMIWWCFRTQSDL